MKAEVDRDNPRLDNSSYYVKPKFNNCFIIYSKELTLKLCLLGFAFPLLGALIPYDVITWDTIYYSL